MPKTLRFLKLTITAVVATAVPAMAQGCAQCYTQAASAGDRFIQALRSGILVLIFPPLLMSVAIAVLAYKKRAQFREGPTSGDNANLGW